MADNQEHLYFLNSLYRDTILPQILGQDTEQILYWAGKHVSRKYDLSNVAELPEFFDMAEFGKLEILKERKRSAAFELSGQVVQDRIASGSDEFSLECGIIAECIERQNGNPTEAAANVNEKKQTVEITVQTD